VVFRDLVALETNIPRWGVLLRMFRRLEDRGEVRGGRFVGGGFRGEQFALPEVPESLRAASNRKDHHAVTIAGADPMNLIGILVPGERVHAVPGKSFVFSKEETEKPMPVASTAVHYPRQRGRGEHAVAIRPANQSVQVSLFGGT
jgi:ATP-dependent Lhr-like helicase